MRCDEFEKIRDGEKLSVRRFTNSFRKGYDMFGDYKRLGKHDQQVKYSMWMICNVDACREFVSCQISIHFNMIKKIVGSWNLMYLKNRDGTNMDVKSSQIVFGKGYDMSRDFKRLVKHDPQVK